MKVKLLTVILSFLVITYFSVIGFAQDELVQEQPTIIDDFQGLRAQFKQNTQNPETKEAEFEMALNSRLDSDRVQITWTLTTLSGQGAIFKDLSQVRTFINIANGESYTRKITIIPTGRGEIEIMGKVESFKAGEAFVVTVRKVFETNSVGEILPLTQDYINWRRGVLFKNIGIVIAGGVIAFYGFKYGVVYFKKWLRK